MSKKIWLTKADVKKCLGFAYNFVEPLHRKSHLDFGNKDLPRDEVDRVADAALGKLGELAFSKLCAQKGYKINMDFGLHTGRHNTDLGQDIQSIVVDGVPRVPLLLVDIKTTKSHSHWLLLEKHKYWASVIVMMTANVPKDVEKNLSVFNNEISCDYKGFAFFSDFFDIEGRPWFEFSQQNKLLKGCTIRKISEHIQDNVSPSNLVALKSQLHQSFAAVKQSIKHPYIDVKLKCPNQIGLPLDSLRKSDDDLLSLLSLLSSSSIPAEAHSTSVTQASVNLITALGQLNRSLFKL